MNKYLYVDSEGRVCRIDADTGAMIPVEWETKEEAEAKRFEQGKADVMMLGDDFYTIRGNSIFKFSGEAVETVTSTTRHYLGISARGQT